MARKVKVTKSKLVSKNLDKAMAGAEPILKEVNGRSDPQLTRVFNHYNYVYDDKQSHAWLLQWMKLEKFPKETINIVKSAPTWAAGTTSGWVARMAMNGTSFAPENIQYVKDQISNVVQKYKKEEKPKDEPKVDLQARIKNKSNQLIELCEEEIIDGWFTDPNVSLYDFLIRNNASAMAVGQIRDYYQAQFDEIHLNDKDIKEGFGKDLIPLRKFYTRIFDEMDRYTNNKKVTRVRKPRTPKEKPISKLIEKLQYQKEFGPLKLVSAAPEGIIGAQQLWVYNTKYKVLTHYMASNDKGFSIKGTTLQNWSEEHSISKGLRKPEVSLNSVLTGGKIILRKLMGELTTKPRTINGRINRDTVILRVIK